jgi:hypothetical protein
MPSVNRHDISHRSRHSAMPNPKPSPKSLTLGSNIYPIHLTFTASLSPPQSSLPHILPTLPTSLIKPTSSQYHPPQPPTHPSPPPHNKSLTTPPPPFQLPQTPRLPTPPHSHLSKTSSNPLTLPLTTDRPRPKSNQNLQSAHQASDPRVQCPSLG